jgi:hypothetical protein
MAGSKITRNFTSEVFEYLCLNNMIKHLKHWRRYCVVVEGICGKQSDNANFGLLSHDPWNMYPNLISSNQCSDANYTAVSSELGSGPTSGEPLYYVSVGFNIQQQARKKMFIVKANEKHHFSDLFDKVLYMFPTYLLSIIRSIWTLYIRNCYLSFQFCWLSARVVRILTTLADSQQN